MSYDFTARDVIEKVRELAEANPGNVYCAGDNGCSYTSGRCEDGSIGCIFGQALLALGVELEKLTELDTNAGVGIRDALDALGVRFTDLQKQWMCVVQQSQDSDSTWRSAIESADACINPAKALQECAI